ncbi:carbamoyltransferase HypF [Candidatus Altiarchaeota archaeon]
MPYYRFLIKGMVQGVGFRPYVYRKAYGQGSTGYVRNIGHGVEVMIDDKGFLSKLTDPPPLATISDVTVSQVKGDKSYDSFDILESKASDGATLLPADIFTCPACLKELDDEKDRRHGYYFITCTNCGPRFSMITDYPYDRPYTSMSGYQMCDECRKEYTDPLDRRYHAQTVACKDCGPRLRLTKDGHTIRKDSDAAAIAEACRLLRKGEAISVKGVGGFHVCCLADDATISKVRKMLGRPNKPFALMARDVGMAKTLAIVSKEEEGLLRSPARPIVVLEKLDRKGYGMVSELGSIGIMLPYTALHHMIAGQVNEPLVMTSANLPGDPVAINEGLSRIALTHEREIVNRCDDSVIKVMEGRPFYLRRSRGFVPHPIRLPNDVCETICVGAELNNVVGVGKDGNFFPSQYIGQTGNLATQEFMRKALKRLMGLTRLDPKIIACDQHPGYYSTSLAADLSQEYGIEVRPIQHHKAHAASVAGEHGLTDYVGIVMDGLGYGDDGNIWGGEVFSVRDGTSFRRVGSLEDQPQLGADSATIYPAKMLYGILSKILSEVELKTLDLFPAKEASLYDRQLAEGFNVPSTSSTGRILDAVAAFIRSCDIRTYDGRPAMILESLATDPIDLEPVIRRAGKRRILDTTHLFRWLIDNKGADPGTMAATSQMYIAKGLYEIAADAANGRQIVFAGGVAYNRQITGYLLEKDCLVNQEIPAGDGGIAYGQAILANR